MCCFVFTPTVQKPPLCMVVSVPVTLTFCRLPLCCGFHIYIFPKLQTALWTHAPQLLHRTFSWYKIETQICRQTALRTPLRCSLTRTPPCPIHRTPLTLQGEITPLTRSMTCCRRKRYRAFSCSVNSSRIGPVTEFGGDNCENESRVFR